MKQDNLLNATKKAIEIPLEVTQSVITQSKRLRHPSPKIDRLGTALGYFIGLGMIFFTIISLLLDKPTWAVGSFVTGSISLISNHVHKKRMSRTNGN